MTGAVSCVACGIALREGARFCDACGSPTAAVEGRAEYKQVTVLFADVVHSMEIAAAVGPERLREIMAELVNRATAVVERYGGTVDKFTGDGIMALFGAPKALEDHAIRACRAALDLQTESGGLAEELSTRDGVSLALRVGLNSGQVIAGEVGGKGLGYTAVGEQVGMAQRMESVAPPNGIMLSSSTARLVADSAVLADPEMVCVKGTDAPITARRLLGVAAPARPGAAASMLVGRDWEIAALTGLLNQAVDGQGGVVSLVGPPGIGKSRLAAEISAIATRQRFDVFWTACESHTDGIPFHTVAALLRAAADVAGLQDKAARSRIRERGPGADPDDLLLLDDLLGIADPDVLLPDIDPDARRRRLTALVNALSLARERPALFLVEDVHWIDEVSESMIADFAAVLPQTSSMAVFTYRPEYDGALSEVSGAQTIALAPLVGRSASALATELLGTDQSVAQVAAKVAARSGGNPLYVEELIKELEEREILVGTRGAYQCHTAIDEVTVPASLQATIAARIDRLTAPAKRTLGAAAVVGHRFTTDVLADLNIDPVIDELLVSELVEPVVFASQGEYAFRHPLIRAVAYESQLKSDRADTHRKLAAALEARGSADETAALIADHLEAAGDLDTAYDWHMRSAAWSLARDIVAAHGNWRRARDIADRMPDGQENLPKRIAPRTWLCITAWRCDSTINDSGFHELEQLCVAGGDNTSLTLGMSGVVMSACFDYRYGDAARMATQLVQLTDGVEEQALRPGLLFAAAAAKCQAGEVTEALVLVERAFTAGPTFGAFSDDRRRVLMGGIEAARAGSASGEIGGVTILPLAIATRAMCRFALGLPGFGEDFEQAVQLVRNSNPTSYLNVLLFRSFAVMNQAINSDPHFAEESGIALRIAEQSGDDSAIAAARAVRATVLAYREGDEADPAIVQELGELRRATSDQRFAVPAFLQRIDFYLAKVKLRRGELDDVVDLVRPKIGVALQRKAVYEGGPYTMVLVEALLQRGSDADLREAEAAVERLAAEPVDPGFVLYVLPLLRMRALVAQSRGDHAGYLDYRDQYRAMARRVDFKPHIAMAEAMD